ncbi:hypothetical protein AAEX28_12155 [Lentisphaerota bacterium WC36G]|nr:hypothetical protein LJT99_14985 [Lentisphaerae bacterium WC36]
MLSKKFENHILKSLYENIPELIDIKVLNINFNYLMGELKLEFIFPRFLDNPCSKWEEDATFYKAGFILNHIIDFNWSHQKEKYDKPSIEFEKIRILDIPYNLYKEDEINNIKERDKYQGIIKTESFLIKFKCQLLTLGHIEAIKKAIINNDVKSNHKVDIYNFFSKSNINRLKAYKYDLNAKTLRIPISIFIESAYNIIEDGDIEAIVNIESITELQITYKNWYQAGIRVEVNLKKIEE